MVSITCGLSPRAEAPRTTGWGKGVGGSALLEIRDIEIFLTLAEELHFGRTAARLHVSQARVSQAIKQQERRIGGTLFDRSNRRDVRLTPLGRLLRDDLRPVHANLLQSLERARCAARGVTAVIRVGAINSNAYELRPIWEAFRSRHPGCELRFRHIPFPDPFGPLRRSEIDVLVCWLPVEEPDLTVGPVLFTESRVITVGADHTLAERGSASLELLADRGVFTPAGPVPDYWEDAFMPFHAPSGRVIERRAVAANWEEVITLVAAGELLTLSGGHATRFHARPDIRYVPLDEGPSLRWALIWRTEAETAPIQALAQTARSLGTARL